MTTGSPDKPARAAVATWDAEGGALPTAAPPEPGADDELLLRLGAALVREWNSLPTATQRALYDRAVSGPSPTEDAALKREMAVFLHDHMSPAPPP